MNALFQYISTVFKGVGTLLTGMKITGKYVFTPWNNVTQHNIQKTVIHLRCLIVSAER